MPSASGQRGHRMHLETGAAHRESALLSSRRPDVTGSLRQVAHVMNSACGECVWGAQLPLVTKRFPVLVANMPGAHTPDLLLSAVCREEECLEMYGYTSSCVHMWRERLGTYLCNILVFAFGILVHACDH